MNSIGGMIGSAASLLGLFFSFFAWRRARDAKDAANQARNAVRQTTAGEEIQRLAMKARDLLHFIENDQLSAARIRSGDLILDITQAQHRWKMFLPSENRDRLQEAARKAGSVTRALAIVGERVEAENRTKLVDACREIVSRLAVESGNIQSDISGGKEDGDNN